MEIDKILNEHPALISKCGGEMEDLREEWLRMTEIYDHDEGRFELTIKATNSALKVNEIKSMVKDNDNLHLGRLNLIVKESEYRHKEKHLKGLQEELNSAKVIAKEKIKEWMDVDPTIRRQNA